uniref:acylphosphatase n=1 Tax=Microbulbifer agarilyticus TaxID=260552 RepID=UPI0002559492|nr:acylphosphatase [Microbulbifer agarilyticus]
MHDGNDSSDTVISEDACQVDVGIDDQENLEGRGDPDNGPCGQGQPPLPIDDVIQNSGPNDFSASKFLQSQDDVGIQLLCNAAANLDLDVRYHRNLIFEVFNESRRVVFRQNSPENSSVYAYCVRKKQIAKSMMAAHGVPVPSGSVFRDYDAALAFFTESDTVVTVKPTDGSAGHGVTSQISTEEEFFKAWEFAKSESREVLVEQHIFGDDVRIIVIGGRAEAAYVRVPACVMGDGKSTVRELVAQKNTVRRRNPSLRIDPIRRFDLLERHGLTLDYVPEPDESVQLTSVANASAGGETVQILDYLDREAVEIAERAANCFPGLVQVGVDLIYVSPDHWHNGMPRAYIIEVNSNPGISDAVFPSYGRPVNVPEKVISHMFSEDIKPALVSTENATVSLAEPYRDTRFSRVFGKGNARQAALVKQAAYKLNLQVEQLADGLYRLTGEHSSCLFHHGMPDRLRLISRKITRNGDWMKSILPTNLEEFIKDETKLNQFRLLVVGGRLVSVLHLQAQAGRTDVALREVGDQVHQSIEGVLQRTLPAIFYPPLVGIDFCTEDISSDLDSQPWRVMDAVCNPHLSSHHFPSSGPGRDVATALVSHIFNDLDRSTVPKQCERFVIRGQVQGVGFRRWLKWIAILHSIRGWVRNRRENGEDVLEAVLEGSPVAIQRMYTLCHHGPKDARVDAIDRSPLAHSGRSQFSVIG